MLKGLLVWHSPRRARHTLGLWLLQLRWSVLAATSHRHKTWNPWDPPEFLSLPLLLHRCSVMEEEGPAHSECKWQEEEEKQWDRRSKEGIWRIKTQPCCSSMFVDLLGLGVYLLPCWGLSRCRAQREQTDEAKRGCCCLVRTQSSDMWNEFLHA